MAAAANGARTTRANWIRRIRINRHLTQAQVANRIGVTANQVSRYEHARDDPGLDVLDRLLLTLECRYGDLTAHPNSALPPRRPPNRAPHPGTGC
jgi:transcriptional regulator with XRE-family HTH domain